MRLSECPLWDSARFVFRMSLGRSFTLAVTFFGCTWLLASILGVFTQEFSRQFFQNPRNGIHTILVGAVANKAGVSVAIPNKEGKLADAQMTCTMGI